MEPNSTAPSTRLHLRFAAATAVVIATAGGALLLYVRGQETRNAERTVASHARFVEKFNRHVLLDGGLRVKLYGAPDGLVTYSNVHSLIGTKIGDIGEFREVLGGRTVRDVAYLNHEGGSGKNVKALEVYVPLRLCGRAKPQAVLEIYEAYAPSRQPSGRFSRRSPAPCSWRSSTSGVRSSRSSVAWARSLEGSRGAQHTTEASARGDLGGAASVAEDGRDRPARRGRTRFQQPAARDQRLCRVPLERARGRG